MKAAKDRKEEFYDPARKDHISGRNTTRLELWEEHPGQIPTVCGRSVLKVFGPGAGRKMRFPSDDDGLLRSLGERIRSGRAFGPTWMRWILCVCAQCQWSGKCQRSTGRTVCSFSSSFRRSRQLCRTVRPSTHSSGMVFKSQSWRAKVRRRKTSRQTARVKTTWVMAHCLLSGGMDQATWLIAHFLQDWEVAEVALSCHIALDMLRQELHDVERRRFWFGFWATPVFNDLSLWAEWVGQFPSKFLRWALWRPVMRAFPSPCGPLFFVGIVRRERRHVSPLQEFEAEGVSTVWTCS